MKREGIVLAVGILLLAGSYAAAAECGLLNGSFEANQSIEDISVGEPNDWEVDLPAQKFRGYVYSDWATDGDYSLTLGSEWFVTFSVGETATVSQEIVLDDVEQIVFDLNLLTLGFTPWDPNDCTAAVWIDEDVVWESAFGQADIRGEYPDQVLAIDNAYRDGQPHRLSLGLRIHSGGVLYERYTSQWDAVECVLSCGGGGFLPADFNRDCFVDAQDLLLLATIWLGDVTLSDPWNLAGIDEEDSVGRVNFFDFAVFGWSWRGSSWVQEQTSEPQSP